MACLDGIHRRCPLVLSESLCHILAQTNLAALDIDVCVGQHTTVLATAIDTTGDNRPGDIFGFILMPSLIAVLNGYLGLVDVGFKLGVLVFSRILQLASAGTEHIAVVIRSLGAIVEHLHGLTCYKQVVANSKRSYIAASDDDLTHTSVCGSSCGLAYATFMCRIPAV